MSLDPEDQTEGFFDALENVAKVGLVTVPRVSSLLGPVGTMVGPTAGAILASAFEAAIIKPESSAGTQGQDSAAAERALLAEASLQAVLAMEQDTPLFTEILTKMEANWAANAPNVDAFASKVLPYLTDCALDIATNKWALATALVGSTESTFEEYRRPLQVGSLPESMAKSDGYPFVKGLLEPTIPLANQKEGFNWLGSALKYAVSYPKPLVTKVARAALGELVPKPVEKVTNIISGHTGSISSEPPPNLQAARILLKRAVMADTALQALMSLSQEKLQSVLVYPPNDGHPEGLFDFIKTVVQKIGPIALATARRAVRQITPALIDAAANSMKSDSSSTTPTRPITQGRPRSLLDQLLDERLVYASHLRRETWDDTEDRPVVMREPSPDF